MFDLVSSMMMTTLMHLIIYFFLSEFRYNFLIGWRHFFDNCSILSNNSDMLSYEPVKINFRRHKKFFRPRAFTEEGASHKISFTFATPYQSDVANLPVRIAVTSRLWFKVNVMESQHVITWCIDHWWCRHSWWRPKIVSKRCIVNSSRQNV